VNSAAKGEGVSLVQEEGVWGSLGTWEAMMFCTGEEALLEPFTDGLLGCGSPILCFAYSILMPELRFEDINTYLHGEEAQPDQNNHTNTTEKKVLEFYTRLWRSNVLSFSSKW